ncbi:GNAT family N-acetyltransferase [Bradyrhizobium xenonodulans]|uniref:GNAT family N-acetyltransferase n=1 Tax=Bradyrhizobium xenonodulans TaxID=2736875 RepID=A0ABY7MPC5_9BRAD|nr:GNAT family N-acetyltransferase [Bradyrhizobium xenonodulans]WBL79398.1 GNAT family N-acetyltransferase [Bradyrhizobium xenonodulans]
MPTITVERTIGTTKKAVLAGLSGYNHEHMGTQRLKGLAVSLKDRGKIVGGVVGQIWTTVLFIQFFWIEQKHRGQGHGAKLIAAIEDEARRIGAVRSHVDTMSFQAPGFYRSQGYEEFGVIDGYPGGVTRHSLTKSL